MDHTIVDDNSKVLILGTYPGEQSLRVQEYYADKRNQFWKRLERVFSENIPKDKTTRQDFLTKHGIVLWDICKCCERIGNSDKKLKCTRYNEIVNLIANSNIERIFCNGKKAYTLFNKHFKSSEIRNKTGYVIKKANTILDEYYKLISSSGSASGYFNRDPSSWEKIK